MDRKVKFFYDNAGYSYGPGETAEQGRARCAEELARAERWAWENDAIFCWDNDSDDCGDGDETPETREYCLMYLDGECVASLYGIADADDAYRRVIRAELALQVMAERAELAQLLGEA